jgi:hypothetical protein
LDLRPSPVELFYDPATLTAGAPRLYVWLDGEKWRLEDEAGTLLSTHPTQEDAIDDALGRSKLRFSEILARGSNGRIDQDPELLPAAEAWRKERFRDQEAAD